MRSRSLVPAMLVLVTAATACGDAATAPNAIGPSATPSASVRTGETFRKIAITSPSVSALSLTTGTIKQMAGTLYYSLGGTLPSSPYAAWSSSDPCVATVTSAYPSWGKVTAVAPGTARIIASVWGKADTVTVTVTGTGTPSQACYDKLWYFNTSDVSFTGTPSTSYHVSAGETLKKVVLFAPKDTLTVSELRTLSSELWYSAGGKLNGVPYVNFTSTDAGVATVDFQKGVVTARAPGRTKLIVRLGTNMADTVPVFVK
jgi:hypothetical protein